MSTWDEHYHFPREMRQQAEAIKDCLAASAAAVNAICDRSGKIDEVHIVGSGDCYFISVAAAQAFRELCGVAAYGCEAYDYFISGTGSGPTTLVVLFSSSGKSLYVIKSAEMAKKNGAVVVGMTNHPESPLGEISDILLDTAAIGVSKSFPTKTTTASLSILYLLASRLGLAMGRIDGNKADAIARELHELVPQIVHGILHNDLNALREAAQMFLGARCYMFVGSGYARAAAMVGAAKIVETNREHVTFCNAEEYMHLHGFAVKSSDAVVVIGNNASNHREEQVADYAREQQARVLIVGDVPAGKGDGSIIRVGGGIKSLSPMTATIASMVVVQMFAAELSRKCNKDPDIVYEVNLKKVIENLYTGPVAGWNVPD